MLLAEKLGIQDQQALQEVLATSFGCSEVLKRHMPIIQARYSSHPVMLDLVSLIDLWWLFAAHLVLSVHRSSSKI